MQFNDGTLQDAMNCYHKVWLRAAVARLVHYPTLGTWFPFCPDEQAHGRAFDYILHTGDAQDHRNAPQCRDHPRRCETRQFSHQKPHSVTCGLGLGHIWFAQTSPPPRGGPPVAEPKARKPGGGGLVLIDFSRSIDMRLYPQGTVFKSGNHVEGFKYPKQSAHPRTQTSTNPLADAQR